VETFAGRRIFVVDDDEDQAESLALVLRIIGCDVAFVTDPRDALAAIEVHLPELAFIDLGIPHVDGYELTQRIRRRFGTTRCDL
jgi:CheY-like chemotaxis protein